VFRATLVYKTLFLLRGTPHLLDESSWGFAVHICPLFLEGEFSVRHVHVRRLPGVFELQAGGIGAKRLDRNFLKTGIPRILWDTLGISFSVF
jgi:hypothetical protein